jgi:hypothetical protein
MEEKKVLYFSIKWHPPSAKNFSRFLLFIYVESSHYKQVSRKIYDELKENNPQLHPISKPTNILLYSMFAYDIFMVDSILTMVQSWDEILEVEIFIPEEITQFSDWITSKIKKFSRR